MPFSLAPSATFCIAMTLVGSFATARASASVVVLNNLDQPP